jgi:RNA-binding protein
MSDIPDRIRLLASDPRLQVTIRVGKAGLTESVSQELEAQLVRNEVVKAKLNRGLAEDSAARELLWGQLEEEASARLVMARGNVAVFWRR